MFAARRSLFSQRGFATKQLLLAVGGSFLVVVLLGLGAYFWMGALFPGDDVKPVTLTYWGLWESEELMQPFFDSYHELHPNVTITYEQRPIENHFATVKTRIQPGSTSPSPDIVRLHDSWVPALRKYLSPIPSSVINPSQYESVYYSVNRYQLYHDGKYYAIPLEIDGLALVYNQDLFNKAGIATPPATWDDLRRDAAKITQRDKSGTLQVAGVAMGTTNNIDHFPDIIGLLMAQNGVSFVNANEDKVAFHLSSASGTNPGAEALAFYRMFATSEKDWDDKMVQSTVAFAEGRVGMILIPSWRLLSLVSQNPDLPIKVAPVPHLTTDQKTGYASYWVEAVPESSEHKVQAWKFLQWLTEKEQQLAMVTAQQETRPFGEPYSRRDLATALTGDEYLDAYTQQAPDLLASFFAGNTGANEYNDAINAALATAVNKSGSLSSATSAIKQLAEDVTEIREKTK